jgi:arylsulfatase A-like enzyme
VIVEESGHVAIRSDRYRYIRYKDGSEELYDHATDPQERTNLASREELAPMKQRLASHLPTQFAKPAATKKAYQFDPQRYSWANRKTGQTIIGK